VRSRRSSASSAHWPQGADSTALKRAARRAPGTSLGALAQRVQPVAAHMTRIILLALVTASGCQGLVGSTGGGSDPGTVITSFTSAFTGPAPAPGWSYSWNELGELGSPGSESPLLWNGAGTYDSDAIPGSPDPTALNFGFVAAGKVHPGRGTAQGEAHDRFVIASYTVPQDGFYSVQNGTLDLVGCEFGNGVEFAILVDNESVHRHLWQGTDAHEFSQDLGGLQAGSRISVAVGPNGNDGCDRTAIDWDLFFRPGQVLQGEAPVVTIDLPDPDRRWRAGEIVALSGSAVDAEDGALGNASLRWEGTIVHNAHFHPDAFLADGATADFEYPDHGDNSYVEVCLIATDSDGQRGEACVDALPEVVSYTFESLPSELPLTYNGESALTPFSVEVPVGGERLISAPWLQSGFLFEEWSIGGPASRGALVARCPCPCAPWQVTQTANCSAPASGSPGGRSGIQCNGLGQYG